MPHGVIAKVTDDETFEVEQTHGAGAGSWPTEVVAGGQAPWIGVSVYMHACMHLHTERRGQNHRVAVSALPASARRLARRREGAKANPVSDNPGAQWA